ncbi:MAG: histidinol dehydrogenase [Tannerella sp.]|nr:histidinol dehydrogenase [Tannerella sp.]
MKVIKYPEKSAWSSLQQRFEIDITTLFDTVRRILDDVRKEGDAAVFRYGKQFDKAAVDHLKVTEEEIEEAADLLTEELKQAIRAAQINIEKFHASQRLKEQKIEIIPGVTCWQKAVPVEKVGLYIPGGTAPLFSTVLMLAIPARIAGCRDIILCSPPGREGKIHPAILFAAQVAGVNRIYKVGGVQAIASMAYGTETVPKVYKIFGPGNQYVTTAKQLVSLKDVAIDMPAGPSEVAIIADATANPVFIAWDFLSQAEHGADSQSILLTASEQLADDVAAEIEKQIQSLPRKALTGQSLDNSRIVVLKNDDEIISFTNQYAPEHLIINTANYAEIAADVLNAGSIFLGAYTPESAGDYASGTNHTLPTKGYAKMYSGVNLDSFMKKITLQEITQDGLRTLGPVIEVMAANEQLDAHKNAVTVRLSTLNKK